MSVGRTCGTAIGGIAAFSLMSCAALGSNGEGQSPAEMLERAIDDLVDISVLHIEGTIDDGRLTVAYQAAIDIAGNCTGALRVGTGSAEFLQSDGQVWVMGDQTFWTSMIGPEGQAVWHLAGDRYVTGPTSEFGADGLVVCNRSEFTEALEQVLDDRLELDLESGESDHEFVVSAPDLVVSLDTNEDPALRGISFGTDRGEERVIQFEGEREGFLTVEPPLGSESVNINELAHAALTD